MQKIIEGKIKPFKSTFDLRFYNNTIEEDYESENIFLRRVFGIICAVMTSILSGVELYMNLVIKDDFSNFKFSFIVTLCILVMSILCFILLFFITCGRKKFTFFILLFNNILSSLIFIKMKISIRIKDDDITRNYLYSFFFYFINDIEYIYKIYYIFYCDNHFLRNFIANIFVIIFSWLYTNKYVSHDKFTQNKQEMFSLLLTYSIVILMITILSYFKERNYRMLFLVKYDLIRRNEQLTNLLGCMKCGILVYNENQEIYTNDYIRNTFPQSIFANFADSENKLENRMIMDKFNNFGNIKEDQKQHMVFEKVEINNFMENLENINHHLPLEVKSILNLKQFILTDIINEIKKNRLFFVDFAFLGNKSLENELYIEIFCRVKKSIIDEYTIEFLFNDVSRTKIFEEIKQQEIYKKIFLAKTAHEFKNPLISISEIIDKSHDYLSNIYFDHKSDLLENFYLVKSLIEFMLNLITDFSFLSAHDTIKYTIHNSTVNLEKFTKFCVSVTKSIISKTSSKYNSNIKVTSNIDLNLPTYIITDELKLKQILLNLLSNSVKFTKIGWIMMKLKKVNIDEKSYVKFIIIDTGTGVDDSIVKNLFEEFNKTNKMNNVFGSGLGLSVVRELTSLLGKAIEYKRNESKGITKFYFWIEIKEEENQSENEILLKSTSEISKKLKSSFETLENKEMFIIPKNFKFRNKGLFEIISEKKLKGNNEIEIEKSNLNNKLNIIVIDDETLVRNSQVRMIKTYLKRRDIRAKLFEGEDGLECLYIVYTLLSQGKKIKCILIDETMKFLSGSSCAKIMNELIQMQIIPYIPIYIITAYEDKFINDKILTNGVKKIISKPLINSKLDQIFEEN